MKNVAALRKQAKNESFMLTYHRNLHSNQRDKWPLFSSNDHKFPFANLVPRLKSNKFWRQRRMASRTEEIYGAKRSGNRDETRPVAMTITRKWRTRTTSLVKMIYQKLDIHICTPLSESYARHTSSCMRIFFQFYLSFSVTLSVLFVSHFFLIFQMCWCLGEAFIRQKSIQTTN